MICNALLWSFDAVVRMPWLELVKTSASVATVAIALLALRNWQRQDKAKREAEFLDALIEATHEYITDMARPTALVDMARIGMRSHTYMDDNKSEPELVAEGAVPYILKNGEDMAARLIEALNAARPATIKLRSLGTKGQVFQFAGYTACYDAMTLLTWQFDRIEAFASIVGSPLFNWEHPEVRRSLDSVLTVEPDDIRNDIGVQNVAIVEFARSTYAKIYGKRR